MGLIAAPDGILCSLPPQLAPPPLSLSLDGRRVPRPAERASPEDEALLLLQHHHFLSSFLPSFLHKQEHSCLPPSSPPGMQVLIPRYNTTLLPKAAAALLGLVPPHAAATHSAPWRSLPSFRHRHSQPASQPTPPQPSPVSPRPPF